MNAAVYSQLSDAEKTLLLAFAQAHTGHGDESFVLWTLNTLGGHRSAGLHCLSSRKEISDVPGEETVYLRLQRLGFLEVARTARGSLEITISPAVLDFARYQRSGPRSRIWQDIRDDLLGGKPLHVQIVRALIILAGAAGGYLLKAFLE